jgi:Lon protease-like protein
MPPDRNDDPLSPRALPSPLPVFPLEGSLLLPHGHLPLHIFEPRYRAMVDEALGGARVIGMIQPRHEYDHPIPDGAELFATGCTGRIVSFAEAEDGRYFITLKGLCRFRIAAELPMHVGGFRLVTPHYRAFAGDFEAVEGVAIDRERLIDAARAYLVAKEIGCDWQAANAAPVPALITTFAMTCPFEPREKQALLECADATSRGELLISLFEMAVLGGAEGTASHPRH